MVSPGFCSDADLREAFEENELGLNLQVYGDREDSEDKSLNVDIGQFLRGESVSGMSQSQYDAAQEFVHEYITGSGIDITFDSFHEVFCVNRKEHLKRVLINGNRPSSGYQVTIPPWATVSVNTREAFRHGTRLAALIQAKVTNVSDGLSHISTTIDPGWHGVLMITFTNNNDVPYTLRHGVSIGTVTFHRANSDTQKTLHPTKKRNRDRWDEYAKVENNEKDRRRDVEKREKKVFWCAFVFPMIVLAAVIGDSGSFALGFQARGLIPRFFDADQAWWISVVGSLIFAHSFVKKFVPNWETIVRIILGKILGPV